MPDEPKTHFVPPQFPPHDFKAGSTQLEPIRSSFEDEQALPVQAHSLPSEPSSLLDSYIPSKIIAAQDAARYDSINKKNARVPYYCNYLP